MTMTRPRLNVLLVALSLLAIGGLLGTAVHGHEDGDDHSQCLLCAASFGHLAVPGAVLVFFLAWTVLGRLPAFRLIRSDDSHRIGSSPRAPPA